MRIHEAYEHEPLLSCSCEGGQSGCGRIGTQCLNIAASAVLTPVATVREVTVSCQGTPVITCESNGGASCTMTITQQVCVSVPVNFGVTLTNGDATIACADNNCIGCGC